MVVKLEHAETRRSYGCPYWPVHQQAGRFLIGFIPFSQFYKNLKQVHLLQEKLDERFPTDRIDFTRDLPRSIALKILSKLDPRSLSRCAQVSWYWKWLSESDDLWRPKVRVLVCESLLQRY